MLRILRFGIRGGVGGRTKIVVEQREDATQSEQIEAGESETEDTSTPDRAASKNYLPS